MLSKVECSLVFRTARQHTAYSLPEINMEGPLPLILAIQVDALNHTVTMELVRDD
jgi:hypothetical protein